MGRKKKKGHGEAVIPPRSLFDKASMLKVRREGKDQKKNFSLKQQVPFAKPLPSLVKPTMEPGQDNPEWLISEDWALLQVRIQNHTHSTHSHTHTAHTHSTGQSRVVHQRRLVSAAGTHTEPHTHSTHAHTHAQHTHTRSTEKFREVL